MDPRPAYTDFAPYYDVVYHDKVDYAGDVEWLLDVFRAHARRPVRRVADLGSGTGTHALALAARGVSVVGVDLAEGLVRLAREKAKAAGESAARVEFVVADMAEWEPAGAFDAAVSMFGAFNYVTDDARAARLVDRLARAIPAGGLLVFEFWNPIGVNPGSRWDRSLAPDGTEVVRLFESSYDLDRGVVRLDMDVLVMRGHEVVDRLREVHDLRARTPHEVRALVEPRGFEIVAWTTGAREGKTLSAPQHDDFRIMCVARRAG